MILRHVISFNAVHNKAVSAWCSCREFHGIYMSHPYWGLILVRVWGGGINKSAWKSAKCFWIQFHVIQWWVTLSCWDETLQPGNLSIINGSTLSTKRFVYATCVKADSSLTQGPCEHTLHHSRVTISFYSTLPTGLVHCFMQSALYVNLMICLKVLETLYSRTALLYKWDILWFSRITYTILSVILNFMVNNSKTICNVIGLSGTITELGCYLMQSFFFGRRLPSLSVSGYLTIICGFQKFSHAIVSGTHIFQLYFQY